MRNRDQHVHQSGERKPSNSRVSRILSRVIASVCAVAVSGGMATVATTASASMLMASTASRGSVVEQADISTVNHGTSSSNENWMAHPSRRSPFGSPLSGQSAIIPQNVLANDPFLAGQSSGETPNQYWFYRSGFNSAWNVVTADGQSHSASSSSNASESNHRVTIALLDSTVQTDHADLKANMLPAYDAVGATEADADSTGRAVAVSPQEDSHGTMVAGIISAIANNGIGLAGGSHNATILPINIMFHTDQGAKSNTATLDTALKHVISSVKKGNPLNIRVVNMSLKFDNFDSDPSSPDQAVLADIQQLRELGVVTVCAGGNGPTTSHVYPSDEPQSVAVTALTPSGSEASYSDYNADKDISAPGDDIWSTTPGAHCATDGTNSNCYAQGSGTSFAAPIVSAALALLFSEKPGISADQALQALYQTAGPISYSGSSSDQDRQATNGSHGSVNVGAAAQLLRFVLNQYRGYVDTPASAWYSWPIAYATWKGYMSGYGPANADNAGNAGSKRFGPTNPVTRAEAATLMWRTQVGSQTVRQQSSAAAEQQCAQRVHALYPGDGASVPNWAACAVEWAHTAGVMDGFHGTSNFGPNAPLKREEAAKIFAQAAHADTTNLPQSARECYQRLLNNMVTENLLNETMWAVGVRILNGFDNPDGTANLNPTDPVSRAQMARMMQNALNKKIVAER